MKSNHKINYYVILIVYPAQSICAAFFIAFH